MASSKEKTLEALLDAMDNNLSPEDFLSAFEKVMERQTEHEGWTKTEVGKVLASLEDFYTQLRQSHASITDTHKGELTASQERFLQQMEHQVSTRLNYLKDGEPGRDGEPGKPGRDGSPDRPEEILAKVRSLKEDGIQIADVHNLKKELDELKQRNNAGGTSFAIQRGAVKAYDLSSSLDGVTRTFALPAFWRIISVHLSSFPSVLRPTVDYTEDATLMKITLTSEVPDASIEAGQTLIVVYAEG